MNLLRWTAATALALGLAMPAWADAYKTSYPDACSVVWSAVKDTLSQHDHFDIKSSDDSQMTVDFQTRYRTPMQITGVQVDRSNHVTLAPKGSGCTLQISPNYSGWSRSDATDFKKRVEASLAKSKSRH